MRRSPYRALALLLLAAAGATAAAPAGDDRIEIQADSAELDRAAGQSIYRGDVTLTRGGLELRGDKLVVSRGEDERVTAVLTGDPAHLRQTPVEQGTAPITGSARRMTYETGHERIELTGEAVIERGGNAVRGETITHDLASGRTVARRADGENGDRVRITLDPPRQDQNQDQGQDGDGNGS